MIDLYFNDLQYEDTVRFTALSEFLLSKVFDPLLSKNAVCWYLGREAKSQKAPCLYLTVA